MRLKRSTRLKGLSKSGTDNDRTKIIILFFISVCYHYKYYCPLTKRVLGDLGRNADLNIF